MSSYFWFAAVSLTFSETCRYSLPKLWLTFTYLFYSWELQKSPLWPFILQNYLAAWFKFKKLHLSKSEYLNNVLLMDGTKIKMFAKQKNPLILEAGRQFTCDSESGIIEWTALGVLMLHSSGWPGASHRWWTKVGRNEADRVKVIHTMSEEMERNNAAAQYNLYKKSVLLLFLLPPSRHFLKVAYPGC